jgi:hypothetical protein
MIIKFAKLSDPEFKKAINQLLHGHLVVYDEICWLQIRRKKTLVVTCASRYSKDNLTQELGWITTVLADLMDVSEDFKRRMDSLRLAIALIDRLDRNRRQICTVYAASCDDLGRFNYDVKWPLSSKEVKARIALRKRKAKSAAIKDSIRSIPALGLVLLMFFCVGAIAYFSARYFGSEIVSVAVGFAVITFGLVFVGSSVVEFVITIGVISLPAYFIFTGFPRTQIMGFDIDIAVGPEQFLRATLIGLVLGLPIGLLVRFIGSHFFD